jgi:hypothetical protein
MKHKYYAAAALAAWLLVIGWLASMVVAKPAVMRVRGQTEDSPAALELRQNLARNVRDMALLARFDGLPDSSDDGQPLLALTPPPLPAASPGNAADPAPDYVLSLVVSHDQRRRAVVNGQYLSTGSRLDNGAKVLAIGPDWIRLDDPANGVRTLHVRNPLRGEQTPSRALPTHGGRP